MTYFQISRSPYTFEWLANHLGKSETGLSATEFAMTIVTLLNRSSDDLQTELFDLLGFDQMALIQDVLEHRQDIVDSFRNNKKIIFRRF